jgi:hypothetical protein
MALDTITISDANGVSRKVLVDNDGSSNYTQVEKIGFSADDAAPVLVSTSNPLPVTDAAAATSLAAILAKIIAAPATEATLAALSAKLPTSLILGALGVTEGGTYGYAAGTAAGTVDVPTGARVKRVSVLAGSGGSATVTIAGGNTITIPASGSFDEQIPGQATAGADVVIGGTVASYYVSWVS